MLEQAKHVILEDDDQTVLKLEKLFARIHVQAFLVDLSDDLHTRSYNSLTTTNISKLIQCLKRANQEARDVNSQFDVRVKLWNAGLFAEKMALPSLIEVEARSMAALLMVRYKLHSDPKQELMASNEAIFFE